MAVALTTRTTSARGYSARAERRRQLQLASARPTLSELVEQRTRLTFTAPPLVSFDDAITELEQLLDQAPITRPGILEGRVAILRVRAGDWEARTPDGTVGRGHCAGAAVRALYDALRG